MPTAIFIGYNGYTDSEFDGGSTLNTGDFFVVPTEVTRTFVIDDPDDTAVNGDNSSTESSDDRNQNVVVRDTRPLQNPWIGEITPTLTSPAPKAVRCRCGQDGSTASAPCEPGLVQRLVQRAG